MSAALCSTNCGTSNPVVNYVDLCTPRSERRRKSGGSYLLFLRCDAEITDPSLPAQYAAAAAAGQAFCTPCGTWTPSAPTQDVVEVDGCGTKEAQSSTFTIDYSTKEFSVNGEDVKFFQQLTDQSSNYRVIPFTCQEYSFVSDAAFAFLCGDTTTFEGSPGVPFSLTQTPFQERAGNGKTFAEWKFQIEICKDGVYADYAIDGILPAICG